MTLKACKNRNQDEQGNLFYFFIKTGMIIALPTEENWKEVEINQL